MLRYTLNAAISMDSGAPQAHELLLAEHGSDKRILTIKKKFQAEMA